MVCANKKSKIWQDWVDAKGEQAAEDEWARHSDGSMRPVEEVYPDLKSQPETEKSDHQQFLSALEELSKDKEALDLDKNIQTAYQQVVKQIHVMRNSLSDETKQTIFSLEKILKNPDTLSSLRTYAHFLLESRILLQKYETEVKEFNKSNPKPEQLSRLRYYYEFANSYNDLIKDLDDAINQLVGPSPVKDMLKDLTSARNQIVTAYEKSVIPLIAEVLADNNDLSNAKVQAAIQKDVDHYNKIAEDYKQKGDLKKEKEYKEKADALKKFGESKIPTKDLIESMLRGEKGDSSYLSMMLEASISNGDAVISSFGKFIKNQFHALRKRIMPLQNEMSKETREFLEKTGRVRGNNEKAYQGLFHVVKRWVGDKSQDVMSLLGEFDGVFEDDNYITKQQKFIAEEVALRKEGKIEQAKQKRRDYVAWKRTYLEREYTPEYYAAYDLLTDEARKAREKIMENIRSLSSLSTLSQSDLDELRMHWNEYKALGYPVDKYGQPKKDEELRVAESIQAFNKKRREMISYELTPKKRALFERFKKEQKAKLDAGVIKQEEYDRWIRNNTTREIDPAFYEERQRVIDKINELFKKITKEDDGKEAADMKELWTRAFAITVGSRDEDGVPDGNNLTPEQCKALTELNQQMEDMRSSSTKGKGLSRKESAEFSQLIDKAQTEGLTEEEDKRVRELRSRANSGIDDVTKKRLGMLFKELRDMQSHDTTEYYKELYEQRLSSFINQKIQENPDYKNATDEDIEHLFKQEDEWYKNNHYKALEWVGDLMHGGYAYVDRPSYAWMEILPANKKYIREGEPSFKYKERVVNDKYINKNFKSEYDMYGMPKRKVIVDGVEKDSPYISKAYEDLKNSVNEEHKAMFKMLNYLTKVYLDSQKNVPNKLGLVLPSIEKTMIDRMQEGQITAQYAKSKIGNVWEGVKRRFTQTEQDIDEGIGTALGDMAGHEFKYVPMKYTGPIDINNVSLNLASSILRFTYSAEQTRTLNESLPVAQSLQDVLKTHKIELDKFDAVLKSLGIEKKLRKRDESRRSEHISEFVNMIFFNEFEKQQEFLGLNLTKLSNNAMRLGALQILALNVPAQVTNYISGYMQSFIEASSGEFLTKKNLKDGFIEYKMRYQDLLKDAFKFGEKSVLGQLIDMHDVEQGKYEAHLGHNSDFSMMKEMASLPYMLKNAGEHELATALFIGMAKAFMLNQKASDGTTRKIAYYDAWEEDGNGGIKLKDGVELTDKQQNQFNNELHSVLRKTQGNYDKFNRPQIEKEWWGRLGTFMRKYIVPMAVNRWGDKRLDNEAGSINHGFYRVFWGTFMKDLAHLRLRVLYDWSKYTDTEKRSIAKTLTEVSAVFIMYLLCLGLGYDDDNDYKENGFLANHLLYQLIRLKSETENFQPISGVNEVYRTIMTPSIVMNSVKNLLKTGQLLGDMMVGDDVSYQKDYGYWEKGDSKLLASMGAMVGFKGNTLNPDVMVRNIINVQRIR